MLRRFFRLTGLNILSNLTVPLVGLVDTAMLGHLPEIRFLAGVALGGVVFDYVYWSFGFLRMGTTGTTAQAVGRGDAEGMHQTLQRSLLLALVGATAILVLRRPLGDLGFALLAGTPEVEAAGRSYYDARIWGAPAVLANFVFLGWYLGREESRLALAMTATGNLANVALNYLFIVRLGLAAQGAGLATMLSQYLMLLVAIGCYLPRRRGAAWRWRAIADPRGLAGLVRLNLDILIRTVCLISSFAVFTNFSALMGTAVLTANAVLLRVVNLSAYLIDGAAFATESLAGVFWGARDQRALGRLLRLAIATGLGFAAVFASVMTWAPRPVLALLTSHGSIIELAVGYRLWLVPTLLAGAVAFVLDGFFLGLTAGRALRNAMLLSVGLVFLPVALGALAAGSPHLLWLALAAFMAARSLTLGRALRRLPRGEGTPDLR